MPTPPKQLPKDFADRLAMLGEKIRARRKALKVNATAAAEAAGMSRVTLHRIEKGEAAVTIGSYLNVLAALGLEFDIKAPDEGKQAYPAGWIPTRIVLDEYPQLKQLAWQVHTDSLTPEEALSIYQRNERHLNPKALTQRERDLLRSLMDALRPKSAPNV